MDREFFQGLYDAKPEYVNRRDSGSIAARQIALETLLFKIPNLLGVLPPELEYRSAIEIGCGTGELIAAFPAWKAGRDESLSRLGFDISSLNIVAARERFPHVRFSERDFNESRERADLIILSDVLEHVFDDVGFLRAAAARGKATLINLPLENNWLNRNRKYGVDDLSGHLRSYSIEEALQTITIAGLRIIRYRRAWSHETSYDVERRALRREILGAAYSGSWPIRALKAAVHEAARSVSPFGRALYPSNLFVCASAGE